MSIPTGFPPTNGRDGWANFDQATGFEQELLDVLGFMQRSGIHNTIWITTDVHFAEAFRYRPFPSDPAFVVYELATGPLNAGIFPSSQSIQDIAAVPSRRARTSPGDGPRRQADRDDRQHCRTGPVLADTHASIESQASLRHRPRTRVPARMF